MHSILKKITSFNSAIDSIVSINKEDLSITNLYELVQTKADFFVSEFHSVHEFAIELNNYIAHYYFGFLYDMLKNTVTFCEASAQTQALLLDSKENKAKLYLYKNYYKPEYDIAWNEFYDFISDSIRTERTSTY